MKKYILFILTALLIPQNPVSDQGLDQIVEPGQLVTISGSDSYALNGNTIASYEWTVPQEVLDANPNLDLFSEVLVFTAPNTSSSVIYTISLEVTDSQGNISQEYDSDSLILTEYCETSTSAGSANKYIEIYNGTGETITSADWVDYEVWITKASGGLSGDFMNPDQDFRHKLFFHRLPAESDEGNDIDVGDMYTIYPDDLAHGETLLIVKELENADADLIEHSPYEWSDLSDLGGDEGLAFVKDGLPVHVIGEGVDPGSAWSVAGVEGATKDHVLIRKSNVVLGNYLNWYESAGCTDIELDEDDPCPDSEADLSEWIVIGMDDTPNYSFAGSHDCTACDNSVDIVVAIPPVANAGNDFTTCDELVNLFGSGPLEDGDYTYSWVAPGAVPLSDPGIFNPSFTSPTALSEDTLYCFSLTINDGYVDSAPDEVCVTIEANLCPVANAGEDASYRVNTLNEVALSAESSYDPNDGDNLSYEWEQIDQNPSLSLSGENLETLVVSNLPTTLESNPMEYMFELTVLDDGFQVSDPDTVKISLGEFAAPESPNLYAVPYSDYIKLSWDFVSEASIDPLTKYADFEGYKLYRSEDGGETWCDPEFIIYDFEGNSVGCQPIAQFDLTENQDLLHCVYKEGYSNCEAVRGESISEYDPVDGWVYLGENSGLEHIYVDEDVVEGKQYTYTLTAYDMGLRTYSFDYVFLENSISSGEDYNDTGSDGCVDSFEDSLGGCSETENPGADDPNGDNYNDISNSSGTEGNGQYDLGESFADTNNNSQWDGDPVYTQETNWSPSNPNQWTSIGQNDINNSAVNVDPSINSSYPSLESDLGELGDSNFVQAVAGALPSNISEPSADESTSFISADPLNIGNGNRYFDVVDRSELSNVHLKFEIQAEYGISDNGSVNNSFQANKSENPSLYIWEVASDGETLVDSVVVYADDLSPSTSISAELDLPGVYSADNNASLTYPVYIVEDMPITFSDEQGADENWTDLIYGTRFKFDNSFFFYESTKDGALYIPPIREAFTVESDPDSSLMTSLFISEARKTEISYYSRDIFDMRPPYKYKIEFSNKPEFSVADMVVPAQPYAGASCSDEQGLTKVPFRVTNLTTGEIVNLTHRDYGLNDGYVTDEEGNTAPDYGADGRKDCFWTRSELMLFNEYVSTYEVPVPHWMTSDDGSYTYQLDLDYFMFREFGTDDWDPAISYSSGDQVLHQSMIWEATNIVPNFIPPPSGSDADGKKGWFDCGSDLKCNQDEEGFDPSLNPDPEGDDYDPVTNPLGDEADGFNDNPWEARYPWKAPTCSDGISSSESECVSNSNNGAEWQYDTFYFTPIAWYADGDNWTVDLSLIGASQDLSQSDLDAITVVPNPYRGSSVYNEDYDDETIYFKNLPSSCVIKIYTVTGKLVDTINFNSLENNGSGQYPWHLENSNGDKVAPGLYIYYVQSGGYDQVGKFAIVR